MTDILIKLCGMRRECDIEWANICRPDYVGFILTSGFRRSVDYDTFLRLSSMLRRDIKKVGVFVNERLEAVLKCSGSLDVIQLHGDEAADYIDTLRKECSCEIWKAVRARGAEDIESADLLPCDRLVIDSFVSGMVGGSGKSADFEAVLSAKLSKPYFIAGGIDAENVCDILDILSQKKPCGIDASSGLETDGFKDKEKMAALVHAVRERKNSDVR